MTLTGFPSRCFDLKKFRSQQHFLELAQNILDRSSPGSKLDYVCVDVDLDGHEAEAVMLNSFADEADGSWDWLCSKCLPSVTSDKLKLQALIVCPGVMAVSSRLPGDAHSQLTVYPAFMTYCFTNAVCDLLVVRLSRTRLR